MPDRGNSFARVALEVPSAKLFDYTVPAGMDVRIGERVAVPFGSGKRIGVVLERGARSLMPGAKLKAIGAVRDDAPPLPAQWVELMRFLAGYYQRPLGETIVTALPPRLRSVRPLPRKALERPQSASGGRLVTEHALTAAQSAAFDEIAAALGRYETFLLHGVTGSGKTEVYLRLIARVLARQQQALVLVPEIGLTPQLEGRFKAAFPDTRIALMHSALEDTARTRGWLDAARGDAGIVLGTRLAVLAPLSRLGLVIVDEEHDASFKQQEGLRYSGRDVAVYRAKLAGCPAVLGTATPSLETWHNWREGRNRSEGRYRRVEMRERAVPGARLPDVRMLDMQREPPEQGLCSSTLAALRLRLERGEQSLVFINRRGYAPVLACEACGWAAGCERCTARMVVHRADARLRCHHCGAEAPLPRACPTCGNVDVKPFGRGTQRIEESLAALLPGARIVRIDRDTARRRGELERTLDGVKRGEADILVGTQLLAKGHDFPQLTLVAVLNADAALLSTDYRAAERLFAVLTQVAGRAGRRAEPGEVLVQTRYPGHPLFAALSRHDYAGFAASQLEERRAAGFPPYVFEAALRAEAARLDDALRFLRGAAASVVAPGEVRVFDPVPHLLTRRSGLERAQLLVQSSSRPALQAYLATLSGILFDEPPRNIRWHIDVDPIEFD